MNTLYTITINRRKYATTDIEKAVAFYIYWNLYNYLESPTTETIPNVIAL